jgi:hypothetical protein
MNVQSAVGVAVLMGMSSLQSPDLSAMARKFGESAKANGAALKNYSWKMRVEVSLKGEPRPAKLYAMRFDLNGKTQKTELTAPAEPAPRERGLKGRIKEKKIGEMKEWAGDLAELAKGYLTPSAAVLQAFFEKAQAVQAPGGKVQIVADGVIAPGDKLIYELDAATQALTRVMFHAALDGDPVDGQVEFARLESGLNYAARTTVNVPAKQVSARIENFDYQKQ